MKNDFEQIRRRLIAALIRSDSDTARQLMEDTAWRLETAGEISELDQKAVNQLLTAARRFSIRCPETATPGLLQVRRRLKTVMARITRTQVRAVEQVGYDEWRTRLNLDSRRYRLLLQNTASFQLSVGCSNVCRRCNEWALAGVRKHFAFEAARHLVADLHASGNVDYALYCASDPLDYASGGRTVADLLGYMQAQGYENRFGLLTKVPRGREVLAGQLLESGADMAVSLTSRNKARVAAIEARVGRQFKAHHDTDDLMIPAGLDEDFSSVKASITDNYGIEITPEGAWMVIPTFTSALNPTGQCRLPITAETDWFILKKVGRAALPVEYFKPLASVRPDGSEGFRDHLLAPQIENILLDNGNAGPAPPGMMDLDEYFKTFDPAVVQKRAKVAAVAIENIRRQVFTLADRKGTDRHEAAKMFARRRQDYLDFCDPEKAAGFRLKACSYFLEAAADYLRRHPDEREIIRYLRRGDAAALDEHVSRYVREGTTAVSLFADPGMKPFDTFRYLILRLLNDPADGDVDAFIRSNPAAYSSESGRFI